MTLAKFSGVANGANIFSKLRDTLMDSLKNISILILPFVQLWRTFIYVYIFEQRAFIIKIIQQKNYFYGKTLKFLLKRTERLSMKFMNEGLKSFYLSQG